MTGLSWLDSQIDPTDRPDPRGDGVVADGNQPRRRVAAVDYSGADRAAAEERLVADLLATGKIPVPHSIRASSVACEDGGG